MNVGDIVWLKSGGPKMTVSSFISSATGRKEYVCHWFVGGDLRRDRFEEDELTTSDPN
jgi:uncharacterized protein YodC (DUF2158 family)